MGTIAEVGEAGKTSFTNSHIHQLCEREERGERKNSFSLSGGAVATKQSLRIVGLATSIHLSSEIQDL